MSWPRGCCLFRFASSFSRSVCKLEIHWDRLVSASVPAPPECWRFIVAGRTSRMTRRARRAFRFRWRRVAQLGRGLSFLEPCKLYVTSFPASTPNGYPSHGATNRAPGPTKSRVYKFIFPNAHHDELAIVSPFFSTSAVVLSSSWAIWACFCIGRSAYWLHRSPSTTALTGAYAPRYAR